MLFFLNLNKLGTSVQVALSLSLSPSLPHTSHMPPPSVDEDDSVLVPRHLLVFLNPASGSGKTVSDFKQHIQPLFDLAEINYHLIVTGTYIHCSILLCTLNAVCTYLMTSMYDRSNVIILH